MDLETFQDVAAVEEPEGANFATIAKVYSDGVTLLFDGQEAASEKRYKVNRFGVFNAGDRVKIIKDSSTYVVEYPVGNPLTKLFAGYATEAGSASTATRASRADYATCAGSADTATKATSADTATKATKADTATKATTADTATKATSADTATKATSATKADTATSATVASGLANGGGSSTSNMIQLRYYYGTFSIRQGTSGTWHKITTTS